MGEPAPHPTTERAPATAGARGLLEAALLSAPAGVIVTDAGHRIAIVNASAGDLLGADLADLTGRPLDEAIDERLKWRFTNPDDSAAALASAHDAADPTAGCDLETVDGRALRVLFAAVHDDAGRRVGGIATITDVSEARDALGEARALAAERARLLEAEERRAHEGAAIARAAQALSSALTPDDVHRHLVAQTRALVPVCDRVAVLVADRRGVVTAAAHDGFRPETVARMIFRRGEGAVGRVIAGGRPFICNDTGTEPGSASIITGPEGIRSFMHVPIVLGDRVHGLIAVNSARPRAFGERELRLVGELARHAAGALQNALQFQQERHIADTLQRALAAGGPPQVDGLDIATLYRPADGVQVGGDICAVWRAPAGGAAVLIGDVSGRGIEAAGLAVTVRHMSEVLSRHHRAPGDLMTELSDLLRGRLPDGSLVTLALVIADATTGELAWANAGHPAPVLMDTAGGITVLDDPGPPCGAFPGLRYPNRRTAFGPGDLLVLYTDGLTEARRRGREFGEPALHRLIHSTAHLPVPAIPGAVLNGVEEWADPGLDDDIAIVAVRRRDT